MEVAGQNKPVKVSDDDDDVVAVGAYGHQQCSADTYLMLHAGGMSEVRGGDIFTSTPIRFR